MTIPFAQLVATSNGALSNRSLHSLGTIMARSTGLLEMKREASLARYQQDHDLSVTGTLTDSDASIARIDHRAVG
jgi:hypothetical protein